MLRKSNNSSKNKNLSKDKIIETIILCLMLILLIKHYRLIETIVKIQDSIKSNNKNYLVEFCPGCKKNVLLVFNQSKNIKCAYYSINDKDVLKLLLSKNVEIKVFYSNFKETIDSIKSLNKSLNYSAVNSKIIPVYSSGLMHHKFCILDGQYVLLGSLNPTSKGFQQINDFIVIQSRDLAKKLNRIYSNLEDDCFDNGLNKLISYLVYRKMELLDCRTEPCKKRLLYELKNAKERIWFAQFLLTDDEIAEAIVEKSKTLDIKGVISAENIKLRGSDYHKIKRFTIAKKDLHMKVWIIDDKVITGSLNPSNNGFNKNQELMLIINNQEICSKYVDEINKLYSQFEN